MGLNIYLLKDVAQLSGLSVYTVKYYIKLGLIKEIGRSPATNFRYFDDSTVERLKEIRRFRREKMSLRKVRDVMQAEA